MNRGPPKSGKKEEFVNTLLVDGNALFKVGYHGAKDEYNSKGHHIGGIYQFITIIRKLLNENLYHRVYVFWDGKFSGKLRYDIYPDYKCDRGKDYINGTEPEDKILKLERFIVQSYLNDLFIRQIIDEDIVEGDDYIAYYCKTKKKNDKVTIVTNDRDLCQLITDDVNVYLCDLKSYVTNYNYRQYFNHHQSNSVLIKTICGDVSDSIKGVKGIKEKKLLTFFPQIAERPVSLQEILTNAQQLQEERIANKKPPLLALRNLIEGITTDRNGKEITKGLGLYDLNKILVDLSLPMLTNEGIIKFNNLINNTLDPEGRGIKEAYTKMKRDGIDMKFGNAGIEYLMPFKKLIEREKKEFINENN